MDSETAELSFTCTTRTCQLCKGIARAGISIGHFRISFSVAGNAWDQHALFVASCGFKYLAYASTGLDSLQRFGTSIVLAHDNKEYNFYPCLHWCSDHLVFRSSWESACTRKRRSNLAAEAYWKHLKAIFHLLLIICSLYVHLAVNDFFVSGWSGDEWWEFKARS